MMTSHDLSLALLALAAGCANHGPPSNGADAGLYRAARERWLQNRPAAYSFVLERPCFCPPELVGPVMIEVRADTVVSRAYVSDQRPVPPEHVPLFGTIDSVFEVVRRALAGAASVTVRYDTVYGFPVDVGIDYRKDVVDDESALRVTGFRTLPR